MFESFKLSNLQSLRASNIQKFKHVTTLLFPLIGALGLEGGGVSLSVLVYSKHQSTVNYIGLLPNAYNYSRGGAVEECS